MFDSLKSRILIMLVTMVLVSSLTLMFFAQWEIERSMKEVADEESQNALKLSLLSLETQHRNVLRFKEELLESHKRELEHLVAVQETFVRGIYQRFSAGEISEEEARQFALERLRTFSYGDNDYFWVADYDSVVISHPDPTVEGVDFSEIKGIRGNLIVPPLVEDARKNGTAFHRYWWKRLGSEEHIEKLSYGKHFPEWHWILATGFYIDDIERESQRWAAEMLDNLTQSLTEISIAKTGYLFLFNKEKEMLVHPVLSGDEARNLKNPDTGNLLIDELIDAAVTPDVPFEYRWDRPDSPGKFIFEKQSYVAYFEPLGWYVASSAYKDEVYKPIRRLRNKAGLIFLGFLGGSIVLAVLFSNTLTLPIQRMLKRVKLLADLDLSVQFDEQSRLRELNTLGRFLNEVLRSFTQIVEQVQRSGIQVTSSATELSATAKEQETTMTSQLDSAVSVLNAVKEISHVTTQSMENMQHVAAMLDKTIGFAGHGQSDLLHMEEAMRQMENASKSISGRLEAINEKAENITSVVTTINKVAEQTNLLSLNAAIEAEKAGEYGRGFTVVAREIRRLADQTAGATLDIDQMVQEMQSAVTSGIMEMDKFIADVRHSAEDVGKISMQLSLIIEQVQTLAPNFEQVNQSMELQVNQVRKIDGSMLNLRDEMEQTRDALHETYSAIGQLNEAARGLQQEVSRFHAG